MLLLAICLIFGCGSAYPHDTFRLEPAPAASPSGELTLTPGEVSGEYISPIVRSTLGCEQLILSWNVDVPAACGVWFEARVRLDPDGAWTPWLLMGQSGDLRCPNPVTHATGGISIDADTLTSKTWFRDAQIRVRLAPGSAAAVTVHRIDITRSLAFAKASAKLMNDLRRHASVPDFKSMGVPSHIEFDVPFFSQATPRPELAGRLCSPTSVTMVLGWAGVNTTVADVAAAAYDPEHDIYGNWPFNVQAAWQRGVPGKVCRIGSVERIYQILASGHPIVASIKVGKGELHAAPYSETVGHLIVIRGYDESGNFLVNDPACKSPEEGKRVYERTELARAWLVNGRGTCYLFCKPGDAASLDSLGGEPK
jgi:hypothetical protein